MIFTWVDFKRSSYGAHEYPLWADILGWLMSMTSVMAIPVVAIYNIYTAEREEKETTWMVGDFYVIKCVDTKAKHNLQCEKVIFQKKLYFKTNGVLFRKNTKI